MKRLYRCDFCDYIGTEQEVLNHEKSCTYKIRSCDKCAYGMVTPDKNNNIAYFICRKGIHVKKKDGINKYCNSFKKRKCTLQTQFYTQLKNNKYIQNALNSEKEM